MGVGGRGGVTCSRFFVGGGVGDAAGARFSHPHVKMARRAAAVPWRVRQTTLGARASSRCQCASVESGTFWKILFVCVRWA